MSVLTTTRMILRELTPDDADDLLRFYTDPVAMKYFPSSKDRKGVMEWINRNVEAYKKHGVGHWACTLKKDGRFVGQAGILKQEVDGEAEWEVGYGFLRDYWGRGLATEAAIACREYGFHTKGYTRLISIIHPDNAASRRVAEKAGMTVEKITTWKDMKVCVYTIHAG